MDTQQNHSITTLLLQSELLAEALLLSTERGLTCGLTVLGIAQVAQGTLVITQVVEGDACSVHGLEVVPLVAQHLQTVLLHPLVVDQLRLQQACWNDNQTPPQIKCKQTKTKDKGEDIPLCSLIVPLNLVSTELPQDGPELTMSS